MEVSMLFIHFVRGTSCGFADFTWTLLFVIGYNSKLRINNLIISVYNTSKMLKIRHIIFFVLHYGQIV